MCRPCQKQPSTCPSGIDKRARHRKRTSPLSLSRRRTAPLVGLRRPTRRSGRAGTRPARTIRAQHREDDDPLIAPPVGRESCTTNLSHTRMTVILIAPTRQRPLRPRGRSACQCLRKSSKPSSRKCLLWVPNATFAATQKMCVDRLHMARPCGSYVALGGNLGLALPDIKGPNRLPMTASSPTTSPPAAPEKAAAAGRRRERVRRGSGYNPGLCCGSLESARHLRPFDVPANPARSRCLSGLSRAVPSRDWPRPGSRR